MKISTNSKNFIIKSFIALCFILPMFVSCADIKELWGKVEEIEGRLDSLEKGLNGQIEAMTALLEGGDITIAKCSQNDNGSYSITLSNGTEFTVLPQSADNKPLLSYVVESNVKYWAVYDADGVLTPLVDGNGKKIPVAAAVPTVIEKDGAYYLVIDGKEYLTGYKKDESISVITDYTVNTDDSGNIYSVTFTIGDEIFTLTVDGYKGFTFMLGSAQIGANIIKDLYVAHASTYRITAGLDGVVDYVMQIPDGWRVKESKDETTGELHLDITAPSKETVASGAAVDNGDLKVVAVIEGGDAMVARLELSTDPFKTFKVSTTHAFIEKYNGVDKFLYGLTKYSEYDEAAIFARADAMLNANEDDVSESDLNKLLSEIYGSELAAGEKYVLWAIPAFYNISDEDAAYYVVEGLIVTYVFGGTTLKQEVSNLLFNDATLDFSLSGTDSYFGGTCELTNTAVNEIFFRINNGMEEPLTAPLTYNGSVFAFPSEKASEDIVIKSNTTYITWVIPCIEGKDTYSVEDMISTEFTLPEVASGGVIEVVPGTEEVGKVSISVPLTAEGASRIYYLFLTKRTANRHDETTRTDYLLKNGTVVDGESAVAYVENLTPGTERYLYAMAIDPSGKYGPVKVLNFVTDELVYNTVEIILAAKNVGQDVATVGITSSDPSVEYVYWAGKQTEEFWLNLSGSNAKEKAASAQEILALYPDNADVKKAMNSFPLSDGVLNMSGLKGNTVYQVVVIAKDSDGNFSHAGHTQFTTLTVNLGTIVTSDSQTWKDAREMVEIDWHEEKFRAAANSSMSAYYAYDIKVPTDLTAYILCMTEEYFEQNPDTQTLEDIIIDIEAQCSRKYDAGRVTYDENGEYACEPDWVDDNGNVHQGPLLNVYDFYVHGYPTNGFATYFATGSHGAGNCTEWEAGECSNYAYALQHINKRLTIDYYKKLFREQKGLTIQSVIDKAAQDYFDAYYPYYKDKKPLIYENHGEALYMENHYASGPNEKGVVIDDVIIVFKDAQGNYYEPMFFEVPNHFK